MLTTTTEVVNHFSCWCSCPLARRWRSTSEITTATMSATLSGALTSQASCANTCPRRPSTPRGLLISNPMSGIRPGAKAEATAPVTATPTAVHASSRQRGDKRVPSGKRRNKSTSRHIVMYCGQAKNHAANLPAGSEPGLVTKAYMAYEPAKAIIAQPRLVAQNSQPIGCSGRRQKIKAPTAGNARMVIACPKALRVNPNVSDEEAQRGKAASTTPEMVSTT